MTTLTESERILMRGATCGDESALAELFHRHRHRLERMIMLRLDRRLSSRVDPADVLQEAYLELARRLPDYAAEPRLPFFLWLRFIVGQQLLQIHRRHLGAAMRDVRREQDVGGPTGPDADAATLLDQLTGSWTSPSHAARRTEMTRQLQIALDALEPIDREVLVLRYFEGLSNQEVAIALEISRSAASKRYMQALRRLGAVLSASSDFTEDLKF